MVGKQHPNTKTQIKNDAEQLAKEFFSNPFSEPIKPFSDADSVLKSSDGLRWECSQGQHEATPRNLPKQDGAHLRQAPKLLFPVSSNFVIFFSFSISLTFFTACFSAEVCPLIFSLAFSSCCVSFLIYDSVFSFMHFSDGVFWCIPGSLLSNLFVLRLLVHLIVPYFCFFLLSASNSTSGLIWPFALFVTASNCNKLQGNCKETAASGHETPF